MTWVSQNHDGEPRDQEIDLSDGWWAAVGPSFDDTWSWDLYDHWAIDSPDDVVAEGHAPTEQAAKDAALAAHTQLAVAP